MSAVNRTRDPQDTWVEGQAQKGGMSGKGHKRGK